MFRKQYKRKKIAWTAENHQSAWHSHIKPTIGLCNKAVNLRENIDIHCLSYSLLNNIPYH